MIRPSAVVVALGAAFTAGLALSPRGAPTAAARDVSAAGGLVTLHRLDPVTHTLNLASGRFGGFIDGNEFVETRAHLDFGVYGADALTVALEEDDLGSILDLGPAADLPARYEFEEAVGGGRAYASLRLEGDYLSIRKQFPEGSFQHLESGRSLMPRSADVRLAQAPVVPGHVYVVRVRRKEATEAAVWARLYVVDHEPGRWVTLRWDPI